MLRRLPITALIGQERRAANLFVILLLTVVLMSDLSVVSFISNGYGLKLLLPYFLRS